MRIQFNKKFKRLFGDDFSIENVRPCHSYLLIKHERILYVDGSYYFERFVPKKKFLPPPDRSIDEYDNNKIRVDEIIGSKINSQEAFWCGLSIIKNIITELKNSFGGGFEVILSYNFKHCFIRFYKIREPKTRVMSDNLEDFKNDAILRIEF